MSSPTPTMVLPLPVMNTTENLSPLSSAASRSLRARSSGSLSIRFGGGGVTRGMAGWGWKGPERNRGRGGGGMKEGGMFEAGGRTHMSKAGCSRSLTHSSGLQPCALRPLRSSRGSAVLRLSRSRALKILGVDSPIGGFNCILAEKHVKGRSEPLPTGDGAGNLGGHGGPVSHQEDGEVQRQGGGHIFDDLTPPGAVGRTLRVCRHRDGDQFGVE